MTKQDAKDALRQVIIRQSEAKRLEPTTVMTFGQFWRERFLPMYENTWKASSRATPIDNIERYCVKLIEHRPISDLQKTNFR